jgi:hypothetical protein
MKTICPRRRKTPANNLRHVQVNDVASETTGAPNKKRPEGMSLFWPIGTCPAIALATADLPIGQKQNKLCVL